MLRTQPAERKRILDEMVAGTQQYTEQVSALRPSDVRAWLGVPDEATGIRRLLAIIAFGFPSAVRVAQR